MLRVHWVLIMFLLSLVTCDALQRPQQRDQFDVGIRFACDFTYDGCKVWYIHEGGSIASPQIKNKIYPADFSREMGSNCNYCGFSHMGHLGPTKFEPIGEALNPGPWVIRTFNPTQLYKNETILGEWVDGIYTACETSHTVAARNVMVKNLRDCDVNVIFSHPVEKQRNSSGIFRGKASGTMVASRFPIRPYPQEPSEEVKLTSRFVDGIVNIGGGNHVYTCAVYGPPVNGTYADSDKIFHAAAIEGIKRAVAFKGMAAITGDFNRDLHDCGFWEYLRSLGWQDCAQLAWERFHFQPEPTCREATRRSFILINPALARFFVDCRCVDHELFDSHPVLQATFDCETKLDMKTVWNLPRSMDDLIFDVDMVNRQALNHCKLRECRFQDALNQNQMDEALQQFAMAFEHSVEGAAITVDGEQKQIPMGCWKRCRSRLVVKKPVSVPLLKRARDGDLNVQVCQPCTSIRRHVKQCRRVLSLRRQLAANPLGEHSPQHIQCLHLWTVIFHMVSLHGYCKSWVCFFQDACRVFSTLMNCITIYKDGSNMKSIGRKMNPLRSINFG